ncbi:hypothetical protein CP02DC23_1082, partial [Chlamydia psittaci 02DC23]
MTGSNHTRTA